jgi:hypothetical protein
LCQKLERAKSPGTDPAGLAKVVVSWDARADGPATHAKAAKARPTMANMRKTRSRSIRESRGEDIRY